jgi:hypothetical protein
MAGVAGRGFVLGLVALLANSSVSQPCSENPPAPDNLGLPSGCQQCQHSTLVGTVEANPNATYMVHSDLPERFTSEGVLYSTDAVIPANGAPESLRTQIAAGGFTAIDGSFDTFFFHTTSPGDGSTTRRIVVYAVNTGTSNLTVTPKQVILTDGVVGTVHEMETNLGTRVLGNQWDTPVAATTLAPGQGAVIAYGKRFGASSNTSDISANTNCFGKVRTAVSGTSPKLKLYVIAIGNGPISENLTRAQALLNTGAQTGEGSINIGVAPSGCELRRCVGVHDSFVFRSNTALDVDSVGTNGGVQYQMALSNLQAATCGQAQQTVPMLLYPGYARGDSIGNYMVDYRVSIRLINKSTVNSKVVDFGFTKPNADMGLTWKVAQGATAPSDATVDGAAVRAKWVGPNQTSRFASFLESDGGPITLGPCSERTVSVRFMILGNSSLPFTLFVDTRAIGPQEYTVDDAEAGATYAGTWNLSLNAGAFNKYSRVFQGGTNSGTATFTPNITQAGQYDVFARWVSASNRAAAAPFDITGIDGTVTVNRDQRSNGSLWVNLGRFNFATGTNGRVALRSTANSAEFVSADAVRFVYAAPLPVPAAPTNLTATASGTSQINLAWTDNATNEANSIVSRSTASNGTYTDIATLAANTTSFANTGLPSNTTYFYRVRATNPYGASAQAGPASASTGGLATVIVDNTTPGGFTASTSWFPTTSTPGYFGTNYHARATAAVTDPARWTVSLPATGTYRVSARWTSGSNRATAAPYQIVHAGGTATVNVNQRNNGGTWVVLGTYTFNAGTAERVRLSCWTTLNQFVIADAVRFEQQ